MRSIQNMSVATATLMVCSASFGSVLFDNGGFVTGIGNGSGGANTSQVPSGYSSIGSNLIADNSAVGGSPNRSYQVADDFTLSSASTVTSITFYGYSTFTPNTSTSPFASVAVSILSGAPTIGSTTPSPSALATSTTIASSTFTNTYRMSSSTSLTNTDRPVFATTVTFPGTVLAAGTYWVDFSVTGLSANSGFESAATPIKMNPDGTEPVGNARLYTTLGGNPYAWTASLDGLKGTAEDVPFLISGTVPEPTTATLCVGGLLTLARRRRRS